jgi:hypothetical protein
VAAHSTPRIQKTTGIFQKKGMLIRKPNALLMDTLLLLLPC